MSPCGDQSVCVHGVIQEETDGCQAVGAECLMAHSLVIAAN